MYTEPIHLTDENLADHAAGAALSIADAAHLAECTACRTRLAQFDLLVQEMAIFRQSQPSTDALARYASLFSHVQQRPTRLRSALEWVQAQLRVDTRRDFALQGVRRPGAASYRLLYETPTAEIDLLVEETNATRMIEGEIVAAEDGADALPALVQLITTQGQSVHESETDKQGRFAFKQITPAYYAILVTPTVGASWRIDDLEIS
jgi:hypothetical protein